MVISIGQDIPALYGAPVKTSSPLPVIMFSHGGAGMRTTYSATCCDLASHGYLVAAIEHRCVSVCLCVCVCMSECLHTQSIILYAEGSPYTYHLSTGTALLVTVTPSLGDKVARIL